LHGKFATNVRSVMPSDLHVCPRVANLHAETRHIDPHVVGVYAVSSVLPGIGDCVSNLKLIIDSANLISILRITHSCRWFVMQRLRRKVRALLSLLGTLII
jgi:hypothetical protein